MLVGSAPLGIWAAAPGRASGCSPGPSKAARAPEKHSCKEEGRGGLLGQVMLRQLLGHLQGEGGQGWARGVTG